MICHEMEKIQYGKDTVLKIKIINIDNKNNILILNKLNRSAKLQSIINNK